MRIEWCVVATMCAIRCVFATCGAVSFMRTMVLDHTARSDINYSRPEHACPQRHTRLRLRMDRNCTIVDVLSSALETALARHMLRPMLHHTCVTECGVQ